MRDGHLDRDSVRIAGVVLAGGRARRLDGRDKPMVAVGGVPMLARVLGALASAGAEALVVVGPEREGLPGGVLTVREEPPGGGPVAATAAGLAALKAINAGLDTPDARVYAPDAGEVNAVAGVDAPELGVDTANADVDAVDAEVDTVDSDVDAVGGDVNAVGAQVDVVALMAADLPLLTAEAVHMLVDALDDEADGAVFVDEDGRRQLLCGVWRVGALAAALQKMDQIDGGSLRRLTAGLTVNEVRWGRERPPYFDCDTEEDLRTVGDENVLERWLDEAAAALGVPAPDADERTAVLDLARDVAHNVARPGAPLTAFLLGIAVGRGADTQRTGEVLRRLATRSE